MSQKVKKAIIPAAGYGTRFLPFTKSSPKEMLPIVDKPVIQYVVEEAVEAGIEEIVFITSSNKRTLEDHFDYNLELEQRLKESGKTELLKKIRDISDAASFAYVRQKEQKGNGHAILMAKNLVDGEPFLVLWGDEFIDAKPSRSKQLIDAYEKWDAPVITALKATGPDDPDKYGYIKGTKIDANTYKVDQLIEKPGKGNTPSDLASIGGYILTEEIFPLLETIKPGKNGEIILADAINELAKQRTVISFLIKNSTYYDSGSKFGFIKANIDVGLHHPETKKELAEYLKTFH